MYGKARYCALLDSLDIVLFPGTQPSLEEHIPWCMLFRGGGVPSTAPIGSFGGVELRSSIPGSDAVDLSARFSSRSQLANISSQKPKAHYRSGWNKPRKAIDTLFVAVQEGNEKDRSHYIQDTKCQLKKANYVLDKCPVNVAIGKC
jgi:hypothetical protein